MRRALRAVSIPIMAAGLFYFQPANAQNNGDPQISCKVSESAVSKPGSAVRTKIPVKFMAPDGTIWSVPAGTRGCSRLTLNGKELVDIPVMGPGGVIIYGLEFSTEELTGAN